MKETKDKKKHRQPQEEGRLQKETAEQKEYAEACACQSIDENTNIITNLQETGLLEKILQRGEVL